MYNRTYVLYKTTNPCKEPQTMLMYYNEILYLLSISSEEAKNRVIEILTLSQRQPESLEVPASKDHTDA